MLLSLRLKLELRDGGLEILLRKLSDLPTLLPDTEPLRLTLDVLGLAFLSPSLVLDVTGLSSLVLPVLLTVTRLSDFLPASGPAAAFDFGWL